MWHCILITTLTATLALAGCGDDPARAPVDDGGGATDATVDAGGATPDGGAPDTPTPDASTDPPTDASDDGTPPADTGTDAPADAGGGDVAPDVPEGPRCGDGRIDATEVCDDGNTTAGDGCSDTCRLDAGAVALVINEVVASAEVGEDWIELANPNPFAVRADGWALTDGDGLPPGDPDRPFVIAAGTIVRAEGYLVFERDAEGSFGFGFASGGDGATLLDPRGEVSDETVWTAGQAEAGTSWGRSPDVTGDFATLAGPTRGAANPG